MKTEKYRIRAEFKDYDTGENLYWSNDFGWVAKELATVFSLGNIKEGIDLIDDKFVLEPVPADEKPPAKKTECS